MSSPNKSFRGKSLAILALALAFTAFAQAQLKVGEVFPTLAAGDFDGGSPPQIQGKVALVDFWASWCAPCKASFPAYGRINAEYAPRGLVIVAVSVDETLSAYASFIRKSAPPFATVRDQGHKLVGKVDVPVMPTSYLIDRNGRVRFVHVGFHGADTERTLRTEIESLLAEKS